MNFTLPASFLGSFTLFPEIALDSGNYWLILTSPGPPASYANWSASNPATVTTGLGGQFLGYSVSSDGGNTFPTPVLNSFAYQFTVTEVPEGASSVLCLFGLAACCFGGCLVARGRRSAMLRISCLTRAR